ncbi:hypothetical protein MMC29_002488 [Sticta canariensis]|nr:hypothetical protein [Sticta canariensis]
MRACVNQMACTTLLRPCFRCRQPVVVLRHQLRAASSISLEGLVDNKGGHASAFGEESGRKARNAPSNPLGRSVPLQDKPLPDRVDHSLHNLFLSKQSADSKPWRGRYSAISNPNTQDKSTTRDLIANDLDLSSQMLCEGNHSLKDFLQQCKDVIESVARRSSANKSDFLADHTSLVGRDVFADSLIRICWIRSRHPSCHHLLPTTSETIRLFLEHNVMNHPWHDILGIQIGALLQSVHDPTDAEVTREISANVAPILAELLDVWVVYLEEHGAQRYITGARTSSLDENKEFTFESSVSLPNFLGLRSLSKGEDVDSANLSDQHANTIAAAAIVTDKYFQLLVEKKLPLPRSTKSAQSFLRFSEQFTKESRFDRHVFQGLITYLVKYGTPFHIVDEALASCGVDSDEGRGLHFINENTPWDPHQVTSLLEKLNQAIKKSDGVLLVNLWEKFQAKPIQEDVTELLRDGIFSRFIDAFFSTLQPNFAVEVWNLMVKSGLAPKQKHWHAMMVGAARTKDLASMQACWSQMKAAGIKPDILSWTAWIHGLIKCGELQRGIEALEELGRLWKKAPELVNSKTDKVYRLLPSIEPVNAAISAVLDIQRPRIVPKIFRWAKLQKVPLDTSIFNIMLRSAVGKDENKRVDQLLSEMKLHNCQPDIITFTVILEGLLNQPKSSFHTKTPEAQQATIFTLLTTLQQRGLRITGHTYVTILGGLLDPQTANITAALAVHDHMVENKVQPPTQVYMVLFKYYFQATPPDISAIDSLWRRIPNKQGIVDTKLLECMIAWYMDVGEMGRMLQFAREMLDLGKSPSWGALLVILQALVQAQERDLAIEFVGYASDPKHPRLQQGERVESRYKANFWWFVKTLTRQGWLRLDDDYIVEF